MTQRQMIDTHVHMWNLDTARPPWLEPEASHLYHTFGPEEFLANARRVGVAKCVLVEAGQPPTLNRFLKQTAESTESIAAVVPFLSLERPDIEEEIERWVSVPKFRGFRDEIEVYPDPDYLTRPAVLRGLGILSKRGIPFEFLVKDFHLKHVVNVYEQYPDLVGIIDHIGKPKIATGRDVDEWQAYMGWLAEVPSLCCKLSGVLSEAGVNWSVERVKPFVRFVVEVFGFDRVMWGSDWPISLERADYQTTFRVMRKALGEIDSSDAEKLFRTSAMACYRIAD
jgi:L-fuconolactonase